MRTRRIVALSMLLLVAVAVFAADKPKYRSVIVDPAQLREKPSYGAKIVGKLGYTTMVQLLEIPEDVSWAKVRVADTKLEGWVHLSSLSKQGKLIARAGDEAAKSVSSEYEVALATKGFNPQVEAAYQGQKHLDYTWVEKMEDPIGALSPQLVIDFMRQGGVNLSGGSN